MRMLFFDIGETDYKGIEILAALLMKHGHTVDLLLDPGLGKHYYLKLPLLNRLVSEKMLIEKARRFKPDLVGMSIVTNNFGYYRDFAKKLKQELNVPVIVGGIHPTAVPEEVIKEEWVDYLCVGDGEDALLELADNWGDAAKIRGIANLWMRDGNSSVIRNPIRPLVQDIDSHPFPERSIYAQYGVIGRRIRFMSGRGCPFTCSFCVNSFRKGLYEGQHYLRKRSVTNVIEELKQLVSTYHPKAIRFEDDVFVLGNTWLQEFKEAYCREIGLPFHCYITPSGVNPETMKLLREAGCESIAMGIQSGNEELRSLIMNRHYTIDRVMEAAQMIRDSGIHLYAEYMFGFPGETIEQMWETIELSAKLRAYNSWAAVFFPYPGTELAKICRDGGWVDEQVYRDILGGKGSPHSSTILIHPLKDEIFKFKAMLPLYASMRGPFRRMIKSLLKKRYGWRHRLIYLLSIPLFEKKEFFYRAVRLPVIVLKTRAVLKRK